MELKPEKKRVLVFIDWFLPGDKAGGPVRSCANLLDHLGNEFDFSVITRDTDYTENVPMPGIQSDRWTVLPDGKRVYYISVGQLHRSTIARLLREEKYEAVYLNSVWSQPFTAWPLRELKKLNSKARIVLATRGMLASSALAIKAAKKKLFLHLAKFRGLFSNVIFHASTENEAKDIRRVFGNEAEILIAGNLPRKANAVQAHARKEKGKLKIVSVARIAPEKNTLYALEVLAKVSVPVEADFFGAVYDESYWQQCKTQLEKLPATIQVRFPGALPSTAIAETVSQYDLLFMPTRGENFGHIILEALQAGTPVLISDQTPWKNLAKEKAGRELPLHSPEAFAKTIENFAAMDETEFRVYSEAAMHFAEKYASGEQLLKDNKSLFE